MSEPINHYGSVKLRVTGSGNLKLKMYSLDDLVTQDLTPVAMTTSTSRQPVVLSNFMQERMSFEIKTTEIDEHFQIGRIVIYVKPTFSSYPQ